jgi:hypothetical protein
MLWWCSSLWHHVVLWVVTNVSEECITSIYRLTKL